MASVKVACLVLMCMAVVSAPMMVQAITCDDVSKALIPCLHYLMNGGEASEGCCSGVKNILGAAGTTVDKQTVCKCLKDAAGKYKINDQYAQELPGACKVNVPYAISRSTNCANPFEKYNITMATMASVKVACMVVMCMAVVGAPVMVQGVSCNDVTMNLAPCLPYLINGEAASDACCAGVRSTLGAAGTTSDKQTVCNCLKDAANNFGINDGYAQALPGLCKVNVPYKISRSTNCANIRL
ncbi:unnamed protein product [Sphenostylis stenocarpa]|uniref:Non-specific lipid-transfer protein n=1 Tax=Sphenostylis stenocarpa TaxID=92480 RepID=A0AA86S019_9FABA|nr:unnamed protein product [Sphenostylis stenocarpa]